jgi:hypothetical protein
MTVLLFGSQYLPWMSFSWYLFYLLILWASFWMCVKWKLSFQMVGPTRSTSNGFGALGSGDLPPSPPTTLTEAFVVTQTEVLCQSLQAHRLWPNKYNRCTDATEASIFRASLTRSTYPDWYEFHCQCNSDVGSEMNRFSADGNPTLCTLVVVLGGLPRAIPCLSNTKNPYRKIKTDIVQHLFITLIRVHFFGICRVQVQQDWIKQE